MKKLLVWGGLILLLMVVGLGLIRAQQGQVGQGEQAPNFELTTFEGLTYRLSELEGKVVVVNFWASWCESCKPEARDLEEAWRMLQDRGDVVFLGVDYVDTEPEAMAYLEQFEITYPNGPDKRTEISQAFRIKGVPETYVIDREGRIAHRQIGPFQSLEDILAVIEPEL
jgi:cytochrome c biogenesis protein CcmG/thiol:disulfide interchange protein DsbE